MTDIQELLDRSTAKGSFSVLDAAKGRSYPTDDITVYTDVASAHLVNHLRNEASAIEGEGEEVDAEVNAIDEKIESLKTKIVESGITFHLRGFAPGVAKAIQDEAKVKFEVEDPDEGAPAEWCNMKYIAESIITATNAAGDVDEHHWSVDDVFALRGFLPEEEFDRLAGAAFFLSFAALAFEQVVDADF